MNFFQIFKRNHLTKKINQVTEQRQAASRIGYFYVSLTQGDYKKAWEWLHDLDISNILYNKRKQSIIITLGRPGLLIGYKGKNIEALQKFLNKEYGCPISIKLKEEKILSALYPMDPDAYYDDEF